MHELPRPDPTRGVFETMLARDGRIQALHRHIDRLATATTALYGAPLPDDLAERIRASAASLTTAHRLRADAVPRADGLALEITATAAQTTDHPVTLRPVVIPGGIGPYKWRDRRLIDRLQSEDAAPLIMDESDELLEAGSMNVWIRTGRTLITPPADGRLLPGVTRSLLLELAQTLDLHASTERITLEQARTADAIFVTSSIRRISAAALQDGTGPSPQAAFTTPIRTALDGVEWA